MHADAGQFVFVDCYYRHRYGTDTSTDVLWLHFDGIAARPYYDLITRRLGNVMTLRDSSYAKTQLKEIHDMAMAESGYSEPGMARHITDLLTEFAAENEPGDLDKGSEIIEDTIAYIAHNLDRPLTVKGLAQRAFMSEYHFIRIFKRETGLTPHCYITASRLNVAKFLLVNTNQPLTEISNQCGFSSKTTFCSVFKRHVGMTAMQYRRS